MQRLQYNNKGRTWATANHHHEVPPPRPIVIKRKVEVRVEWLKPLKQKLHEMKIDNEPDLADELLCRACYERRRCIVFIECGHKDLCPKCTESLTHGLEEDKDAGIKCPSCRTCSKKVVRVFE